MTDKDEIKFAIRYLKYGLKSKRTPPLYEELMKELGFEKKDKVIQELERENAELKLKLEALDGQTPWKDIKDKSEVIKENAELKERADKADLDSVLFFSQLCKAKEIIERLYDEIRGYINDQGFDIKILADAEQFLKESE
ncbi:MAG: hypothetical protein J6S85_19875 [Methanobrevibacter sp.]|nr:hypothetical protein [Methanobrevibacter sp.]